MIETSNGMEQFQLLSVNSFEQVLQIGFGADHGAEKWFNFLTELNSKEINAPQVLHWSAGVENVAYVTSNKETLVALRQLGQTSKSFRVISDGYSSVSMTYSSLVTENGWMKVLKNLRDQQIQFLEILASPLSMTVIVHSRDREKTIQLAHQMIEA